MNNITVNSNTAPSPKPKSSDSRHWHCYLVVEPKLHHQEHLNIKYDLFSSFKLLTKRGRWTQLVERASNSVCFFSYLYFNYTHKICLDLDSASTVIANLRLPH